MLKALGQQFYISGSVGAAAPCGTLTTGQVCCKIYLFFTFFTVSPHKKQHFCNIFYTTFSNKSKQEKYIYIIYICITVFFHSVLTLVQMFYIVCPEVKVGFGRWVEPYDLV